MNQLESQLTPAASQPPPERQSTLRNFFIRALSDVSAKLFAIITFVYVTLSFLKILGTLPEPLDTLIIVVIALYFISYILYKIYIYIIYDWGEKKVKAIEKRFQKQLEQELNKQRDQLIETISEKPKDPRNDVEESLTTRDIEFAIYCLINKLAKSKFLSPIDHRKKEFDTKKNIIIGIDRGGAIVGGLLGKGLRLATANLGIYWANPPLVGQGEITAIKTDKNLDNIDFSCVEKVILVDDAVRTGETMQEAINILQGKKQTHNFEHIIVCVLNVHDMPGRNVDVNPDYFVYKTKSQNKDLNLPWDELHWDTMKTNEKFDELCANL